MQKTKVAIASVLKPIDDTRMYEKFGLSMAKANKYEVNIIGFTSKNVQVHESIHLHPLGTFPRMSWARLFAPFKVYRILLKLKPQIIIANTHELLMVTTVYKILFGARIIYDIRENYVKNILYTDVFPKLARPFIAAWVRIKEWLTKPFFDRYLLAERVYEKQLPFVNSSAVIIENKYKPLHLPVPDKTRSNDKETINLVYSGTISRSNGIFEAIQITAKLHSIDASVRLKIVGYCALKSDLLELQRLIQDLDYIELSGGDFLVPHATIVEEIGKADFGFVLKKPNNGINDDKLLTRLFEYTSHHLPIIMLQNPTWVSYCQQFNAAIPIDPDHLDEQALYDEMKNGVFYDQGDTSQAHWGTEEPKLLRVLDSLNL